MKGKTDKNTRVIKPLAIKKPSRDVGKLVSKKWKKKSIRDWATTQTLAYSWVPGTCSLSLVSTWSDGFSPYPTQMTAPDATQTTGLANKCDVPATYT